MTTITVVKKLTNFTVKIMTVWSAKLLMHYENHNTQLLKVLEKPLKYFSKLPMNPDLCVFACAKKSIIYSKFLTVYWYFFYFRGQTTFSST